MANYARKIQAGNVLFGIFTLVWFYTRLYLFPFHVIKRFVLVSHASLLLSDIIEC
jgi:hypothetical protein